MPDELTHEDPIPVVPGGFLSSIWFSFPFIAHSCWCSRPFDSCGHHRAAWARAGVLVGRGWALESVMARVCREAGGRVTTNVMIRDLDLIQPGVVDARRLEVVVDGLFLFGGAQLAVDGTARRRVDWIDGWRCGKHVDGRSARTLR